MTSETGIAHECIKYSRNKNLPIHFIIEDNGKSVCTNTKGSGRKELSFEFKRDKFVTFYKYKLKYPRVLERGAVLKKYFEELKKSMKYLGLKKNIIFIGQAVEDPGTAMSNTLKVFLRKIIRTSSCRRNANGNDPWFSYGWKYTCEYFSKMELLL